MATVTRTIGPADRGQQMTLAEFIDADFEEGWLYELARGVVVVTNVPGIHHGLIVERISELFVDYKKAHPGRITYRAGGGECRLRLPGMQSDRHPDQSVYLTPAPAGDSPWTEWCPGLVVEVVSDGGEDRDYVEKREEYLRAGVLEYWILDPWTREMKVHRRANDSWLEVVIAEAGTHRTHLLPGLEVRPENLLGPSRLT